MGMTEDFETSLQVLRGFDTDISVEVNEIKVLIFTPVKFLTLFLTYSSFIDCVISTEICSINKQKSYDPVCRSQEKEILVSSNGRLVGSEIFNSIFLMWFSIPLKL